MERLNYTFEIDNDMLVVQAVEENGSAANTVRFPMAYIFWGGRITIYIPVQEHNFHRFLWYHPMTEEEFCQTGEYAAKGAAPGVLCAYTNDSADALYLYLFTTPEQIYRKFIHVSVQDAAVILKRKTLFIDFWCAVYSEKKEDLKVENVCLSVDSNHNIPLDLEVQENKEQKKRIAVRLPAEKLLEEESEINNPIHLSLEVNGVTLHYNIGKKDKQIKETKMYYLPTSGFYYKDHALFIRRNIHGNFTLVIRRKDSVEEEKEFLWLESRVVSCCMYHIGKSKRYFQKRKINLYFEKDSARAEEGVWEIFREACKSENSRNYFILDKNSPMWDRLGNQENVIAKYSKEYYRLLYRSDSFISTETSSHLNVHRALNPYVRKALLERPLIFLQHGVTYLKRQGNTSVFGKGKEGEPTYMIVGSEKERQVVCEMLRLKPEQCVKTGLPIFSTIAYEHINENSEDIVTIMPTWKPSEEHLLEHFEESSYYQKCIALSEIVEKYLSKEHIRIVPHPKVLSLLRSTSLAERVWTGSVAEALKDTKLLITDYSSVSYNAFYQGAGVIFYQPDLESYEQEVGKLIPRDEEYIGYRTFDLESMEKHIQTGIKRKQLNLSYFRNESFKERYASINEFHDGKNVERIVGFLKKKEII